MLTVCSTIREMKGHKTMKDLSKTDTRYTINKEFCGYEKAMFVLRFCGNFIASYKYKDTAIQARKEHNIRRTI